MSKVFKWQVSFNGKCHQMSNYLVTLWNFSQLLAFFGATFGNVCHLLATLAIFGQLLQSFLQLLVPFPFLGIFLKPFPAFHNFWLLLGKIKK